MDDIPSDYLLQDQANIYLTSYPDGSPIDIKTETTNYFNNALDAPQPSHVLPPQQHQQQQQSPMSSSSSTPLLPSGPANTNTSYNSSGIELQQQQQQQEHFLNLLSQIQQNQPSYQQQHSHHHHDLVNTMPAQATVTPPHVSFSGQQYHVNVGASTMSTLPMDTSSSNNLVQQQPCNIYTHSQPIVQSIQQQQSSQQHPQMFSNNSIKLAEASLSSSNLANTLAKSSINSPPTSPTRRNSKTKSTGIYHHQQQSTEMVHQSAIPPFNLSASPNSSPPHTPLTPPPLPAPQMNKHLVRRVMPAAPTGPSVISIIGQLRPADLHQQPQQQLVDEHPSPACCHTWATMECMT
ncbi:hypothetical protein SAMD00019534_068700 [Acytostelium subglobosum LB1]|uniref:hypothetical protein n=1 Tax=Acytostelium subglobosum LB1 TaxID=1410327 RepID=UPI000644A404|nr:hypothetical protein SAMD00019534_068700 [Acytostelium subglobosum LB1]GAM23695.1 hypothetical protein SAMD00019534_068700 [Acytostelium subglobosum LB1]|eukprot:XP_012753436.1 hypothetical protein SAMD00019534_068700 [Acytostelium subglobosum LB1]